jgi:hypothetical protein
LVNIIFILANSQTLKCERNMLTTCPSYVSILDGLQMSNRPNLISNQKNQTWGFQSRSKSKILPNSQKIGDDFPITTLPQTPNHLRWPCLDVHSFQAIAFGHSQHYAKASMGLTPNEQCSKPCVVPF